MVNVPPLLCSTPPPIDFGDDDEEVDVLPPALGGAAEDYGDFLEGDNKNDEPLPSPRLSSVTDLPSMSIYDGILPPDETYTTPSATPPPLDMGSAKIDTTNEGHQNTPVEAFNFNISHQAKEAVREKNENDDQKTSDKTATPATKEETTADSDSLNESKTANEVFSEEEKQGQATSSEQNANVVKKNISLLANMVSIEDIEDDLSEDELYSPKTPKNFTETDALNNDYFKIHDIQLESITGEVSNTEGVSSATVASEGGFVANVEEDNANITSQNFNMPPPLDELNCAGEEDFADFQDFNSTTITPYEINQSLVDNSVPVNDVETKQLSDESSEEDFDDFVQHTHIEKSNQIGMNLEQALVQDSSTANAKDAIFNDAHEDDFDDFASHISSESKYDHPNLNDSSPPEKLQVSKGTDLKSDGDEESNQIEESINDSFGDFKEVTVEKQNDLNEVQEVVKPQVDGHSEDAQLKSSVLTHNTEGNETPLDDDNDFADFEEHLVMPPEEKENALDANQTSTPSESLCKTKVENNDDDAFDDDDFGDFNTAEPITSGPTTPVQTTSQSFSTNAAVQVSLQMPKNLNERISKILHVMFTSSNSSNTLSTPTEYDTELKKQKIQDIPFTSIDAAKALEYQWLNSETRHSFIKSLGIDSRNILYGENWNPSLPRFAANLSFNPLKPMKPVTTNSGTDSSCTPLDPAPVNTSDFNKTIMSPLDSIKRDAIELDWKSSSEHTTKAFKDNISDTEDVSCNTASATAAASASVPYVATEPPESLTIFENPIENEENNFSKTPPISEMESVNTFSSALPITTLEIDLPPAATQILNDLSIELNESDYSKETIEGVVASTTFSGSFKETHIYTPPKTIEHSSSTSSTSTTSPSKATNIDFDYEKAAMGVIIDETVVKKEYRDIEYNSPFSMDSVMRTSSVKTEVFESTNSFGNLQPNNTKDSLRNDPDDDYNDEFSDFQSVPSEPVATITPAPINTLSNLKPTISASNASPIAPEISKPSNVSACGMILSPAILIPQAISMESNKPKIEWGDSTASINPEELARIEELFPEPKLVKLNNSSSSQKSTPTHQATPVAGTQYTISAAVANKEMAGNNDDDDWSDFVSVPVALNNKIVTNNNTAAKSPSNSPFKQRSPVNSYKTPNYNNSNDDEWCDFVSGAPPQAVCNAQGSHRVPQFNSGAWQNANFYNNPLSLYHKGPLNMHSAAASQQQSPKNYLNNNNNYNQYNQFQTAAPAVQHVSQTQQQIHIMQNFSTAPVPTPDRIAASAKNNQFQVGSAKVAPSIALIPDLGFSVNTCPQQPIRHVLASSFINSLPKPSINSKK